MERPLDITAHHADELTAAIHAAFAAARRQLQDYARVRRGQVKKHAE